MACFGCSRQLSYDDNVTKDFEEDLVKHTDSLTKKKKKKLWISWSTPKKSVAKTVSVSVSMPGKLDASSKSHLFKLDEVNVVPSKKHRRHTGVNASDKTYKKKSGTVKEIILENSEINHLAPLAQDDNHDKKHSGRNKETKKNGSSPPPENKTANRANLTSLQPHKEKKTESINVKNGDDNVSAKNQNREALDSIVGMSVIVVVLVLMLSWGKLCAILCTAAWFYIIPRLRTAVDSNITANNALESDVLNLNSDEHKKKVVLEGLLQRDHRSVTRIL
ncbi:hypothetical protein POM88_027248 [Heracleum sosnowskyi]|uniref:Uncharacterized protein n=1 Tax=Heracleum sosnowskyi TaxID=360622 RepID=A0AAD8I8M1_9APIA|nr:hypothetical protein POM88_027248 [Heracleum sosnowskyi]